MQRDPQNSSSLGKRSKQPSYDEGSSSDTASQIPPSRHQVKRKRSEIPPKGHEHIGSSLSEPGKSYLDESTYIPETTSCEIPESVRSPITHRPHSVLPPDYRLHPKSKISYSRHRSPSANHKAAHSTKPGKLQKRVAAYLDHVDDVTLVHARLETKRRKKQGKGTKDPPPASNQPVASGTPDELKAWFQKLGLPCHPERIDASTGKEFPIIRDKSQPKGKAFSPSTFTQEILSRCCNWVFSILAPEPAISKQTTAKRAYKEKFRFSGAARDRIIDFERPPEPHAEQHCLDKDIINHLMGEKYRMLDLDDLLPILMLPIEWKEQAEGPEPLRYELPYEFRVNLSVIKKLRERPGTKRTTRKPTSETDGSQTDEGPSRAVKPSPQEIAAKIEVKKLCDENGWRSDHKLKKRKERDAVSLNDKLIEMNLVWRKWDNRRELLRAIKKHPAVERHIVWTSLEEIKDSVKKGCEADVTGNEDTASALEHPPYLIKRFMEYFVDGQRTKLEGTVEAHVGSLLREVVAAKNVDISKNGPLRFPRHLSPIGSNPSPDLFVRANSHFRWPKTLETLFPMVFAAEGKGYKSLDAKRVCAQLAAPFHATLIILILYYLDTRATTSSALPPWLFLYGVEYTELSISITAHYPSYVFDGATGHWELHASILTSDYNDIFVVDDVVRRFCFLAVLLRIRSHSLFVLKQLENWERAPIVLGRLLGPLGSDITD